MTIHISAKSVNFLFNLMSSIIRKRTNTRRDLNAILTSIQSLQIPLSSTVESSGNNLRAISASQIATIVYNFFKAEHTLEFADISDTDLAGLVTLLSQSVYAYDDSTKKENKHVPLFSALHEAMLDSEFEPNKSKHVIFLELLSIFDSHRLSNISQQIVIDLQNLMRDSILIAVNKNQLPELMRIFYHGSAAKGYIHEEDNLLKVTNKFGQTVTLRTLIQDLDNSDPHPAVAILCESDADWDRIKDISLILKEIEIQFEAYLVSEVNQCTIPDYVALAQERGIKTIIVGCTGMAKLAALCCANATLPVIGVPLSGGVTPFMKGHDALCAMLEIQELVTVGVEQWKTAALHAARTLSQFDTGIRENLINYQRSNAAKVASAQRQQALNQGLHNSSVALVSPILHRFEGSNGTIDSSLSKILEKEAGLDINNSGLSSTLEEEDELSSNSEFSLTSHKYRQST